VVGKKIEIEIQSSERKFILFLSLSPFTSGPAAAALDARDDADVEEA